jgi:CheY-like chemotaxis protein/two-component sensor histidine kinase
MSHELRTPLNSLLLLARTLEENRQGNLTEDDIESVRVIHNSGNELLLLINDILDLSKVEAGHMVLVRDRIPISDLLAEIKSTFRHLAEEKGLSLHFDVERDTPSVIESDRKRLDQILKNLLSNAVKFTEKGGITMSVSPVHSDTEVDADLRRSDLPPADTIVNTIAIAVKDSGVGIPADKQKMIFDAFKQADGGTARKYGGTGLGLSISKELARLLGGEIQLKSREGEGSTFTLYIPVVSRENKKHSVNPKQEPDHDTGHDINYGLRRNNGGELPSPPEVAEPQSVTPCRPAATQYIEDDRHDIQEKDQIILVIEDDPSFAYLLLRQCHEKGLKCIAEPTGEEGLRTAMSHLPVAIILDLKLPGIDGWNVLENLKKNPKTRNIPVHIMSADDAIMDARCKGAVDALKKPVNREQLEIAFLNIQETAQQNFKNLLVAEQDARQRKEIITLVGNNDVHSDEADSGREVLDKLRTGHYDCLIMGLDFSDMTSFTLLRKIKGDGLDRPPIIIYTDKKLSWEETAELRQYDSSIIIKGVMSEERLLDESALFLHRMISDLPEKKQRMIRNLHEDDAVFQGKRILLVDDDMRNTFALAKVLQDKGMKTIKAEDGVRALAALEQEENFDLVLMDIMMPVMDGYETIKRIRQQPQFKHLPIIALTAKAMKEDRSRCITAGANDYLAKPVDTDRLLALLRLWLYC